MLARAFVHFLWTPQWYAASHSIQSNIIILCKSIECIQFTEKSWKLVLTWSFSVYLRVAVRLSVSVSLSLPPAFVSNFTPMPNRPSIDPFINNDLVCWLPLESTTPPPLPPPSVRSSQIHSQIYRMPNCQCCFVNWAEESGAFYHHSADYLWSFIPIYLFAFRDRYNVHSILLFPLLLLLLLLQTISSLKLCVLFIAFLLFDYYLIASLWSHVLKHSHTHSITSITHCYYCCPNCGCCCWGLLKCLWPKNHTQLTHTHAQEKHIRYCYCSILKYFQSSSSSFVLQ